MEQQEFKSLTMIGDTYTSKKGIKEFRAHYTGFLIKDSEVRINKDKNVYVVSAPVTVSGVKKEINEKLSQQFDEGVDQNGEKYNRLIGRFTAFCANEAEANQLGKQLVNRARITAPVVVTYSEYEDRVFLELRLDKLFVAAPQSEDRSVYSTAKKATAKADELAELDF